jgi:hypothetical protein
VFDRFDDDGDELGQIDVQLLQRRTHLGVGQHSTCKHGALLVGVERPESGLALQTSCDEIGSKLSGV